MKKKLTTLLFTILFFSPTTTILAQTSTGFTIGSNFSYLTGDKIKSERNEKLKPIKNLKPGLSVGIFWDIKSGYRTYIQIGGIYSQQGDLFKTENFQYNNDTLGIILEKYTYKIKNVVNYIKVPLIWKQSWGDWQTYIGLYGAFALQAKSKYTAIHKFADTTIRESNPLHSFTYNLRTIDVGLSLGLGVQLPLNNRTDYFIKFGYEHGFIALNPKTARKEEKMYNRLFSISFGIIINKKGYRYKR